VKRSVAIICTASDKIIFAITTDSSFRESKNIQLLRYQPFFLNEHQNDNMMEVDNSFVVEKIRYLSTNVK